MKTEPQLRYVISMEFFRISHVSLKWGRNVPTKRQGLLMQATYHKVRASRKLLAGMELFQRNFTDHVIICAWIPHTPAHVHHLELVTLFMTEIS